MWFIQFSNYYINKQVKKQNKIKPKYTLTNVPNKNTGICLYIKIPTFLNRTEVVSKILTNRTVLTNTSLTNWYLFSTRLVKKFKTLRSCKIIVRRECPSYIKIGSYFSDPLYIKYQYYLLFRWKYLHTFSKLTRSILQNWRSITKRKSVK